MSEIAIAYNEVGQGIYFHDLKDAEEINWEEYTEKHLTKDGNLLLFKKDTLASLEEIDRLRLTVDSIVKNNKPK